MPASIRSAAASSSPGKWYGRSYSARIACISVLLSPEFPSTSTTSPVGFFDVSGHSVIRTITFCPFSAPFTARSGTKMSTGMVRESIVTKAYFSEISIRPTKVRLPCSSVSTTSPSTRPSRRRPIMATRTRSPCIAWWVLRGSTIMSFSPSTASSAMI